MRIRVRLVILRANLTICCNEKKSENILQTGGLCYSKDILKKVIANDLSEFFVSL